MREDTAVEQQIAGQSPSSAIRIRGSNAAGSMRAQRMDKHAEWEPKTMWTTRKLAVTINNTQ